MCLRKPLLTTGLLLSLMPFSSDASLTAGTADGKNVVYSSVSNITWTGDANLLGTMISSQGYDTVVNAVIAASPIITDVPNIYDGNDGRYSISAADFSSSNPGRTSWFGAKGFANYLNSISYAGSSRWSLPSAGAADSEHIPSWAPSPFGDLFFRELGGSPGNINFNTSFFTNEQEFGYWLSTEIGQRAWNFHTGPGDMFYVEKTDQLYAWVVVVVPVPAALWLFGAGLVGLFGLKRRPTLALPEIGPAKFPHMRV